MIEKVNPSHPDKIADRIAGALVDLAYYREKDPKIAVEVLIGHGRCYIIAESDVYISYTDVERIVKRIAGIDTVLFMRVPQDEHLAENQSKEIRCGDNGIFKGMPLTAEQKHIGEIARDIYGVTRADGKYILNNKSLTICQSNIQSDTAKAIYKKVFNNFCCTNITINPLGDWTGGLNVDSGATNRKLGSDMADAVTGGGLHGKDLSKADVSVNIYAFLKAQETGKPVELCCSIGDKEVDGKPYSEIVEIARNYIRSVGGFEKFAEWGLF